MTVRPTGLQGGINYLGVEAPTPANSVQVARAPTAKDYNNFQLGDFWLNTTNQNVYVLVSKAKKVATWILFTSGAGDLFTLTPDVGGVVLPVAGNINIHNTDGNVVTSNEGAGQLGVDFATNIVIAGTLTANNTSAVGLQLLTDRRIINRDFENNSNGPQIYFSKSRSLPLPGNTVQNGDVLGQLIYQGSNGAISVPGATISAVVAAVPTAGMPTILSIATNNNASVNPVTRMTIDQNGAVTINATDAGQDALTVTGNISLPDTNVAGTQGVLHFATGVKFINNFPAAGGNTFVGQNAGNINVANTGARNSGYGTHALQAITSGTDDTAVGQAALFAVTTGTNNTAVGSGAGAALITGSNNAFLGGGAGGNYTGAESANLLLANAGVLGESNVTRIGGAQTKAFISGVAGVTTTVADAVPVLISASTGQLGTVSSSIKHKENVLSMGNESNPIMYLNPVTFNYKQHTQKHKQYGLIAEEVAEIIPNLVNYDQELNPVGVKYHDLPVLLLNELQKLYKRVKDLESSVFGRTRSNNKCNCE